MRPTPAALFLLASLTAACGVTAPPAPAPTTANDPPTAARQAGAPSSAARPTPSLTPSVAPTLTPTPRPLGLLADFEDVALGALPPDWVDVASEGTVPSWVYAGKWRVAADTAGNRVFLHDDVRVQPAVSFQRYRGDALGTTDGRVPPRYHAECLMRPLSSPHNYPPTGDQGVQFYYLAPARYMEVVVKPTQIEVWEADGGEPRSSKGWKRLFNKAVTTEAGQVRHVGATVDLAAGTFEAFLDGRPLAKVRSALIKPGPAWVALRGIGNVVSFDDVRIRPIEAGE